MIIGRIAPPALIRPTCAGHLLLMGEGIRGTVAPPLPLGEGWGEGQLQLKHPRFYTLLDWLRLHRLTHLPGPIVARTSPAIAMAIMIILNFGSLALAVGPAFAPRLAACTIMAAAASPEPNSLSPCHEGVNFPC
jgi:hypothetical protein